MKKEEESKMKIIKQSEWMKNNPNLNNSSGPVIEGPKVIKISSDWQSISKAKKHENREDEEKPNQAEDDDFVLDFGESESEKGGLDLGQKISQKNHEEKGEEDINSKGTFSFIKS